MAEINDPVQQDDLSALSWVHDEVRRSLEQANKALRRYLKEQEQLSELDTVDPGVLRQARAQLHQSVGVLELVGLGRPADLLRAAEAALQRLSARPRLITPAAVDTLERGSFALLDFIGRRLAGKPVSTLALFPQYRALQELAGATRIHPADLWTVDFSWRELALDDVSSVRHPDADTLSRIETDLLALMRGAPPGVAARMSALFTGLAAGEQAAAGQAMAGAPHSRLATLWQLAAGFFEAQDKGLLQPDAYSKRIGSRLLAQLRAGERAEPSERLAHDLLFFCAQATPRDGLAVGPRLAAVRRAYGLADEPVVDYEQARLGRHDPAWVAQARKRVVAAKEVWSAVAGGDLPRLPGLPEPFALVADSLARLYPDGGVLGRALQAAAAQTLTAGAEPPPELAMEVATALLYLEASLDDGDFDHPDSALRVQRLGQRIDAVRELRDPGTLELWMEELYRRVSDRQTMGSVVQELRSSLSEVEKHIDQYFRDPARRELLIPVPAQLSAMRGVLSVLGLDQASQAVLRMRDDVDALANTEVNPQHAIASGTFDRLADNLGALSFLIDMVSVQPQMAKSLFRFDPDTGSLAAVMARADRPTGFDDLGTRAGEPHRPAPDTDALAVTLEFDRIVQQARTVQQASVATAASPALGSQGLPTLRLDGEPLLAPTMRLGLPADEPTLRLADLPDLPALPDLLDLPELTQRGEPAPPATEWQPMDTQQATLAAPLGPEQTQRLDLQPSAPVPAVPPASAPAAPAPLAGSGLEDDPEMREIFLEEAQDVLAGARTALAELQARHDDPDAMTTVRRAFHTLKGSARMVGLAAFGDAAWACEQLYNSRLAEPGGADHDLRAFSADACGYFERWVQALAAGDERGFQADDLVRPADALRNERRRLPVGTTPAAPTAPPEVAAAPAAPAMAELAPPPGLRSRVPDLPLASDLDLLPLPAATPAAEPAEVALPPLDLAALDDERAPVLPADALIEVAEATEVELPAELAAAFGADLAPAAVPEPEPLPAPVDELTRLLDEGLAPLPEPAVPALPGLAPDEAPAVAERTQVLAGPLSLPEAPAVAPALPDAETETETETETDAEAYRQIGPLRVSIPLFNIYLNEADELSRRLGVELAEWALEQHRPVGDTAVALAHSLAGSSGTVGYLDLSQLARSLEHALERAQARGHGRDGEAALFTEAADEIRRLLHLFAAGFLNLPEPGLVQRLHDLAHAAPESDSIDLRAAEVPAADQQVADERLADDQAAEVHLDDSAEERATEAWLALPPAETAPGLLTLVAEAQADQALEPLAEPLPGPAPGVPVDGAEAATAALGRTALLPFTALAEAAPPRQPRPEAGALPAALDEDIDQLDAVDPELQSVFTEEVQDLLPQLQARLRDWSRRPGDAAAAAACMRSLHTLKGSARLAGAMRLGEMAHRLESAVEHLAGQGAGVSAADVEALLVHADALQARFDSLAAVAPEWPVPAPEPTPAQLPAAPASAPTAAPTPVATAAPVQSPASAPAPLGQARPAAPAPAPDRAPVVHIDWQRFAAETPTPGTALATGPAAGAASGSVRVRTPLLDRLVNQAGEVSIARARIESDVGQLKGALGDLNDNLERLRSQLRDIELQAETQIGTRMEAARAAAQQFDPLEMDRFTRFQELTRMMAESVADVATVQRGLQRTLQSTEDALAHQARMTRDMQDDLLRTRMVEFEGLSERLYRVVRQAAKETGKPVRLDIVGGSIEIDRGVLDRMTSAFEHLLRNSVVHGIEAPAARAAAGKDATGTITLAITQVGNEVGVEVRDDGAGLDLARIRERGRALGLIAPGAEPGEADLAHLIFQPGFTTATSLTDLAGRGVGMDVVRTDVNAMGGRIETASAPGQGTSFRLVLPLTTAVTRVVMLRCGERAFAVPSTLVEVVQRMPLADLARAYETGLVDDAGQALPFFWLDALLAGSPRGLASGRTAPVVVIRSAAQRVVLHVDEVLGNQEVVVKNLGPQLSRVPGLVGMTLLPSGLPALIYNPVALATLYGDAARSATQAALQQAALAGRSGADSVRAVVQPQAPLVLVVDDSLTVRRVTQRLLQREGYRVALAKDGLDGLEKLAAERPAVLLTDIEMPRMDGFDLVRNMRNEPALADLPVIMITSRIAQKHRDYAAELGVDHYLGKPYAEDELLALVARYVRRAGAPVA